jgi:molybdopterin-dependent oxidoreductase alpha subunit
MAKPRVASGGGLAAILYTLRMGRKAGGMWRLFRRMRTRNACKTCALGMGGQRGGMRNEAGHFPEVCKKSVQAQVGDMQAPIPESLLRDFPLARLERLGSLELEGLGRIGFPMIAEAGDTRLRRIGWDDALARAADALRKASPDRVFFYSSGRSSNEAAFLMQLVARAYGTRNIHNCSSYCHNASSVALSRVYGSGTASIVLDDLAKADLAIVAGANPASNHPRLMTQLVNLRRRGGKVIVVNPLRELGLVRFRVPSDVRSMLFGSTISDVYLQPHVGADAALFKALLKGVIELGALDTQFIEQYTSGFEAVAKDIASLSWASLCESSGVARDEIERTVELLARAKRGIFCWAMGLTHHEQGVANITALANLALARGWLGRPGAGLLPIRGHSNVQGVGSVGVAPALKAAFAERLEEVYAIPSAHSQRGGGLDTYASMEAAAAGNVDVACMLGGNLFASNPDRAWARDALRRIPLTVYASTKLNEGHLHGRGATTLILPVLARDEETQATTQESMFNFVRLSDGGSAPASSEMRSEVEVIASLAERVLPPDRFDWAALRSHQSLRRAIATVVPGYGGMASIEASGELQLEGRTFHAPSFPTADGRARFHVTPQPSFAPAPGAFRLMTLRSEGQFNTVVYEAEDLYRGNTRRDVVMLAAADAESLGVAEGDRVTVLTETGAMPVHVAIVEIRPGSIAMYYPEANVLVPRRVDRESGTPAFKSIAARIVTSRI